MQRPFLFVSTLWLLATSFVTAADVPRFSAMLANGQRLEGARFHDWYQLGTAPRLDNQELMNAGNPLSWIRDRTLAPTSSPRAYIEMTTGDRLPGEIVSYESGDDTTWASTPPHFVVRPAVNVSPPTGEPHQHVRVLARFVRRIVRQPRASAAAYQPGTLFTRQGRTVKFRAARFVGNELRLLTEEGQQTLPLGDIGQLHLPAVDPWDAYIDELALISPKGEERLLQFDSTDGVTITASTSRFQILTHGDANNSDHWWHALQPAWSLDTLWLQNTRIWARRSWAFDQVPLSRFLPTTAISKSLLGTGQRGWQTNVSAEGRPVQANAQSHGWGFGVHAYSELHFALPEMATGFRTRMCLDDAAGTGGCVIARVFAGSITSAPLFQSPHLVGSKALQDTGVLNVANIDPKQRTLILQCDAAANGRPQNSDPLDIRDVFDWLDPTVTLDATKLRDAIRPRVAPAMLALSDWKIVEQPEGDYAWQSVWEMFDNPRPGQFITAVRVQKQPLRFVRELKVEPQHQWLLVSTYRQGGATGELEVVVRIDGVNVTAGTVPQRSSAEIPRPLLVPLAPYLGHTIRIEVLSLPPTIPTLPPVRWYGLEIADQAPMLYRVLEDDGDFQPTMNDEKSTTKFIDTDKYTGQRSLELTPGGGHRTTFARPIEVRGGPNPLQKRFVRFAFRKAGLGAVSLELEHNEMQTRPAIYTAGIPLPTEANSRDVVWVDDELPNGATIDGVEGTNSWKWSTDKDAPVLSGTLATRRTASDMGQQFFFVRENPLVLADGDRLFAYVYLDPKNPPKEIMLQAQTADNSWEHRAYWGENLLNWGGDGGPSRRKLGDLPKAGEWVRLEVPINEIGITSQTAVHGIALTQHGGTVSWDKIGARTTRDQNFRKATAVWNLELPDQWIVMTRDVFGDFGDLDITGVILRTPDGQRARFDHIYFARAGEDFQLLPQSPPPEITNQNARRELARTVLDRGHPATVAIEIEDRFATGVLVGGDGLVLTAGHLLVAPGKAATVYLPDGHQLPAKTLGIYRGGDLGIVQITDRQDALIVGLDLHDGRDFTQSDLYVGLGYVPFAEETPGAAAHIVGLQQSQRETLWTDFLRDDLATGGPLLARDGRIIGTHIGRSSFGGSFLYTKSIVARENWERMKSGEIYGEWFPGSGPMFGVVINSAADGAKITSIAPDTPAAAADIKVNDLIEKLDGQPVASLEDVYRLLAQRDPGAEVTLDLNRGGQKLQQKVKLVPRVP